MKPVSGEANGDQAAHRHADRGERIQGRGKRWLLLRRWKMVRGSKRAELQALFAANRRLFKAHVLREQLDRLWTYKRRTGVSNFLNGWIDALRWQRFPDMDRCIHFGEDPKKLDDRLARDSGQPPTGPER